MSHYNQSRTDIIKQILKGNNLKSLIDLDCNDTDSFLNNSNDVDTRMVRKERVARVVRVAAILPCLS